MKTGWATPEILTDFRFTPWLSAPPYGEDVTLVLLTYVRVYYILFVENYCFTVIDRCYLFRFFLKFGVSTVAWKV